MFLDAATQLGVRPGVLMCEADAEIVRERLENRQGDDSDADWSVYVRAAESWEAPHPETQSVVEVIDTGGSREDAMSQAMETLRQMAVA